MTVHAAAHPRTIPPDIDVVVVSYNQRHRLLACLQSVRNTAPGARAIVVDNASTDGSAAAVRESCPEATLIEMDANVGFAAAVNRGAAAGVAPRIMLLNNDARLRVGSMERLLGAMADESVAACGPRLLDADGHVELSTGRTLSPWNEAGFKLLTALYRDGRGPLARPVDRYYQKSRAAKSVSGACMVLDRPAFEEIGGLDERFFLYAEDVDFCLRLRRTGRVIRYVADAVVEHDRGASSATEPVAVALHYCRSHLAFYRKHHGEVAAQGLRLYLALRFAAKRLFARGQQRETAAALLRWALREAGG